MLTLLRRRRACLTAVSLIGAVGGLLLVGAVTQPTASAWTNPAYLRSTVTSGTWSVGNSCIWVNATTGNPVTPAPACTITSVVITPFYGAGIDYSDPTVGRGARFLVTFSPQATDTMVPLLTLHLNQGIMPSGWAWSTSRLVSTQATAAGPCTSLPAAMGLKGMAWYSTAELVLGEKAAIGSPTVCTGS